MLGGTTGIMSGGLLNINKAQDFLAEGFQASKTAATFAASISSRIAQSSGLTGARLGGAEQQAGQTNNLAPEQQAKQEELQGLEKALAGTVAYMAETHGEKAGTAMMALVYKRLGAGEITEESLGNALLDVTRFVDKNFGIAAGDDFMAQLNGSLNNSLNAFFDNGKNESFFAVSKQAGQNLSGQIAAQAGSAKLSEVSGQYAQSVLDMLKSGRVNLEKNQQQSMYARTAMNPFMLGQENFPLGALRELSV